MARRLLSTGVETYPPPGAGSPNGLLYGLEDRVPAATAWLVGAQQVAAMMVGTITPPLLLSNALKLGADETAYLISVALLASALGAFLQCRRRGPLGSGLLSVTGTSFAFMQPLIQAGQLGGLPLMLGLSCFIAPLQIALAPFLSRFRAFFPPLICGIIVLLIGASLIPTAFFGLATLLRPDAPAWLNPLIALIVVTTIVASQTRPQPWLRIGGMAIGIAVGCVACGFVGGLHAPAGLGDRWLTVPRFMPYGLRFEWVLVPPFAFIYFVSSLEAMGDMTATSQLSGLSTTDHEHWRRLSGGVMADGVTSTVAALFGAFPSTTYAQNNGVIQITGVASRRIGYIMAAILALLGLVPAVGALIGAVPPPVLGALALLLFGLVAASGVRLIAATRVGHREAIVIALSLGVGLGLPTQPTLVRALPAFARALLASGISAGGLTALVLNAVWRTPAAASTV